MNLTTYTSRSEKLTTKIRVSNSEGTIISYFDKEIEENIKKGWNKV